MNYDVVVVGSGLSGATCAAVLAQKGFRVLVVEKNKHTAGQIYDFKNEYGITVHKYGPHIFHTKLKEVWDFLNQYTDFDNYQHHVLSFADGKFIPFPINRETLNNVFGTNLTNDQVLPFLQERVARSRFNNPPQSFRDVVVSQVGEELYSLFFESYTRKQWGTDPENLSPDLAGRIPVRNNGDCRYFSDPYQGMPVGGYSAMIEKMLAHPNIHLLLGCDFFEVKEDLKDAKLLVYTGELDRFFDYRFGKLEYRSVKLDFKTYEQESFQPCAVVNYPNSYDFTRITEFKKLTSEKSTATTVCFEYPSADGMPFYTVPTKRNNDMREQYMQELAALEKAGRVLFVGRLAEYKYYNMDAAVASAIHKIQQWEIL